MVGRQDGSAIDIESKTRHPLLWGTATAGRSAEGREDLLSTGHPGNPRALRPAVMQPGMTKTMLARRPQVVDVDPSPAEYLFPERGDGLVRKDMSSQG